MAEIFLTVSIQVLLEKLLSGDLIKFARRGEGVHATVEKWKRMLRKIKAVLTDAEERQITNEDVKLWLEELRDLADDVDDVLDEFSTEALQRQLMAEPHASSSKVRSLIPTCCTNFKPSAVMFTFKMKSKMDVITARLQEIVKQKDELNLIEHAGGMPGRTRERAAYATTSFPEPYIYGREKDKEAIVLELLLGGEASNDKVCVIPVIGMGGVGKTTLAQLVYNDGTVQNSFDPKAWVCVSEAFDLIQVTKAILESFTQKRPDVDSLNSLQESLKGTLSRKKFLLVLDDVWLDNYEQWTILRRPLEVGAPGSKIIVTARNQGVSSMVSPFRPPYILKKLSNDDCLSVFTQHALGTRDFDAHPNFKSVGVEIVKKCNGLPLAAKALGGLLASKVYIVEWERVLHSQIWDLKDDTIIPALRLSYSHLPPHLKQCFAFCALFPKDLGFREEELVLLWTASGLVQQRSEEKQVEDIGAEYFQDLLSRSFFQSSSADVSKFVMHDLINDLAQLVAGETCFRLEDKNRSNKNIKKARYSSYVGSYYEDVKKFEAFDEVGGCLRSFLPLMMPRYGGRYLTNHVLLNLLPKFTCLRVLSLGGYEIFELPDSMEQLKHLRYLDLSHTKLRNLPEWISTFCNLQTLILRGCSRLKKLSTEMSNLINLRHLDLEDADSLEEMPPKVSKLKNLRKLSKFMVGNNSGSGIGELKNLKYLRGTLEISRLDNVIDAGDARTANLKAKKDLDVLKMEWSSDFNDSRNEGAEEEVLDELQPHEKLKELTIKCYGGTRFPSWVGGTFSDMVFLMFQSCVKCTSLPPLEQLPSLRELSIIDCPKLLGKLPDRLVCLEELVIKGCQQFVVSISSFPKLHKLEIEKCQEVLVQGNTVDLSSLESMVLSNISNLMCLTEGFVKGLRKLQYLKLEGCNGLTSLWQRDVGLLQHLPSLHRLRIVGCPQFVFSTAGEAEQLQGMPSALENLELELCDNLEKLQGQLPSTLKTLVILECENLRSIALDEEKSNNSGTCVSEVQCPSVTTTSTLKILRIHGCPKLESVAGSLHDYTSLEEIMFIDCESLKSLPEGLHNLTHLSDFSIVDCPSLVSFPVVGLPATNLRELIIVDCEKLEALPKRMHNFTSLQSLYISDCPGIVSFPEEGFPTNLKSLTISKIPKICEALFEWGLHRLTSLTDLTIDAGCPNLVCLQDEEKGMMLPTSLTYLEIHSFLNIEYLSSNSKGFQNLTSLQDLSIHDCPKLKSFLEEGLPLSLQSLAITRCPELKCFPEKGLPPSLQSLDINSCPELKCFPEKGLPPSLQSLAITRCPELKCFPEKGLPPSLQQLYIRECPLLKQQCKKDQGRDWPKIGHIPFVEIDRRFIFDPEYS